MITNLEIKNGELTPKFDIYNDNYSVTIDESVTSLDISYEVDNKNVSVIINGNENLCEDDKVVSLTIADGNIMKDISLSINCDLTKSTLGLQNYFESLEIKREEKIPSYVAPTIASICFFVIVISFSILFHKKKKL